MKLTTNIETIIERKEQGIDCTEAESAELKMFLKELVQVGTGQIQLIEKIQMLFPLEYGEAMDELEK
jgi:hypothetical protein